MTQASGDVRGLERPTRDGQLSRQPHIVPGTLPFGLRLSDVLAGRVVIVRRGLAALGLLDEAVDLIIQRASVAASPQASAELAGRGLEALHKALTVRQAFALRQDLERTLQPLSTRLIREFAGALQQPREHLYACRHMYVRIMMPEDVIASERELLAEEFGHMIVHSPHRDSWFSHGTNTVNLWIAIGRVRPGNGMIVYPDARELEPKRHKTQMDPSEPLGVPMSFSLDPGDIIVFHGDHLHSSEVNITDETRFVLTTRFSVGPPRYQNGIGWIPYYDMRWLDSGVPWLASAASRLNASYLRHVARKGRTSAMRLAKRDS
jgi:Phytanoyl-CoA dioxygenase (PhyH)